MELQYEIHIIQSLIDELKRLGGDEEKIEEGEQLLNYLYSILDSAFDPEDFDTDGFA